MDKIKLLLHITILLKTLKGFSGFSSLIIREYSLSALSQGGSDDKNTLRLSSLQPSDCLSLKTARYIN